MRILRVMILALLLSGATRSTQAQWSTSGSYVYTTSSSSSVGIGTDNTNTSTRLHIKDTYAARITLERTLDSARKWFIGTDNNPGGLYLAYDVTAPATRIFVKDSGEVGIGTNTPAGKLTIKQLAGGLNDGLVIERASSADLFQFSHDAAGRLRIGYNSGTMLGFYSNGGLSVGAGYGQTTPPGNGMIVQGNVGIGTTTPSSTYMLSVKGKIRAEEVVVETGWSDFVFDPNYRLAPLSEVARHIETRGHLPGIPTAAEVKANGVSLGAMQTKMMEKVEELTLYVIDLNKRIAELEAENARLKSLKALR